MNEGAARTLAPRGADVVLSDSAAFRSFCPVVTRFGARSDASDWCRESVRRSCGFGSINGMTSMKVAVSLPRETFERAKRAVGRGRAASLSAYVTAALEQKATFDELGDLLDEMLAETGGPMTAVEEKRIDRLIKGPKGRAKK
jgi:Arc/MetJ-type ribon-helix-helix transcriptional regulator